MEGVLWKWTNYWNGWQTRWFVLENGILSYYKSQDEVIQGCKGSVKVSVCQINVSNLDNTRMDLVIPGQQHMYLRAPSSQDRQKWLVALGSAKACLESIVDSKVIGVEDSLIDKKSELYLYCDLLMQQVHAVKSAASQENGPDVEKIEDASTMLKATCDTFIRTVEDIVKLTGNCSQVGVPSSSDIPLNTVAGVSIAKNNLIVKPQISIKNKPSLNRYMSQEES
ncbi:pleckstrin homology domain-containing family A member 3-like [Leptidea sinapis]|uniref:PH domain-containing protein n=1 Tax=Leptidea sinapis TaxID=189913 RepID=A0A5E4Q2L3_9NEOP|nr:pleckstrin homology domain-containing family A member 3-like [Leptidea sinapis]VVC92462.1 unnamed protein product [Leptidea sinapis]